ncbi:MAG: TMEM175 family protein [Vulcanimicrobiaceae bacterium]
MVLQLRLPAQPTFAALFQQWPLALSYAVSYLFITIVWINHHYLLRFATTSTPRLILFNFIHMFPASLVPFSTAWLADSRIAPAPTFVYAAVILMVNMGYHVFASEALPHPGGDHTVPRIRRKVLTRSYITMSIFASAMLIALKIPLLGFAIVTCVLLSYMRPEIAERKVGASPGLVPRDGSDPSSPA